jgi:L-seryl-tRNA(Ser) seleniumtransferase
LPHEPTVAEEVAAGVDIVAVSGDKLMGGPQCGILVGRRSLVDAMKRNPLLRALRVDKMTLSALSATLALHLEPDGLREIPFFAMLSASQDELMARASALCAALQGVNVRPLRTTAAAGGGTLPLAEIPSAGVAVEAPDCTPAVLAGRLRRRRPPVVGRVEGDEFIVDLRTVMPEDDGALADALAGASSCE